MKDDEVTPDGYRIVPALPTQTIKGVQCGQCGIKFDYGKPYGYCCSNARCPLQQKPFWSYNG